MSTVCRTLSLVASLLLLPCAIAPPASATPAADSVLLLDSSGFLSRSVGLLVLEAVEARIATDHAPVSSRPGAAAHFGVPILGVHRESAADRARRTRSQRPERPEGFGAPTAAAPVARSDRSLWLRLGSGSADGVDRGLSSELSAQVVHVGVETEIDAPSFVPDRLSSLFSSGAWLAGVGVAFASGTVDSAAPRSSSFNQGIPLLYPYLGYRDDRKRLYAFAGVGFGEADFSVPGSSSDTVHDVQALVFGTGASVVLGGRPDSLQYVLRSSSVFSAFSVDGAGAVSSANMFSSTGRLGVDVRHSREFAGGRLRPYAGVGALASGGPGPSGTAYELDAGVRFDWRRLSASGAVSSLFGADDGLGSSMLLSGSLRYSPAPGAFGLFLSVAPVSAGDPHGVGPVSALSDATGLSDLSVRAGSEFRLRHLSGPAQVIAGFAPSSAGGLDASWLVLRYAPASGRSLVIGRLPPSELGDPVTVLGLRLRFQF